MVPGAKQQHGCSTEPSSSSLLEPLRSLWRLIYRGTHPLLRRVLLQEVEGAAGIDTLGSFNQLSYPTPAGLQSLKTLLVQLTSTAEFRLQKSSYSSLQTDYKLAF